MQDFRERRCWVLMCGPIDITPRWHFTILVKSFANEPVLLQKHMRVRVLANTLICIVHLEYLPKAGDEEACNGAEVALADQVSW